MGALGLLWLTIRDHVPWLLLWRSQTGTVPSAPKKTRPTVARHCIAATKNERMLLGSNLERASPSFGGTKTSRPRTKDPNNRRQKRAGKRLLGIGPIGLCRPKSAPKKPPRMSLCADEPRFMSNHDSGRRRSAPDSKTLLTNENRGLRGPAP
jgi:hypothetical protein